MPRVLRIALLQLSSYGRHPERNRQKGEEFCRRAAEASADIALFSEMWSIGYQPFDPKRPEDEEQWRSLETAPDGPFVGSFERLSLELSMAIGITYLERWNRAPRNTLTLFDRQGRTALTYSKVHLGPWGPPDSACTPGDTFPVCQLDTGVGPVRIGAMICLDREFPEAARILMLNGAELILTPNACDLYDQKAGIGDVRIAQYRARAYENLVAVAMANYASPEADGRSVAFYPDGTRIVQGDSNEGLVVAEIDLDRVRAYRAREASRDLPRRPEKYAAISSSCHPRPLLTDVKNLTDGA